MAEGGGPEERPAVGITEDEWEGGGPEERGRVWRHDDAEEEEKEQLFEDDGYL